ncbi:NADPH-dependent 7-cyano-7-deazaguanine reductase QueF [Candidatus Trichorickettsia mobilis]|uniref:NADPH-dependent 7-cyano-7-deazaguanine reductase QueF n=1 Tax=Candidatus Trichorickettsia mobilis TaxID=1346319 RepID=UPI0029300B55|nr:NADPH-dependent 7-cyano-7-deazaguanine reductase QueF [Candidatus Trichorickettsia mobilis]
MENILLGKRTAYKDEYDPTLLYPIARKLARDQIGVVSPLPFKGFDVWNCYEVSWLQYSGKPEVRVMEIIIPADSENIIESKSLKLYLNSLNNTKFNDDNQVVELMQSDLSKTIKSPVTIHCQTLDAYSNLELSNFTGVNIDLLDVSIGDYNINTNLLSLSKEKLLVEEVLYSNLLKSNCCVTGQPDWASIQISYKGLKIDHSALLKYLISFRNHQEFHEQCVERVFTDIKNRCNPEKLTVYARYTRRGGVDINPIRSTDLNVTHIENLRQIRQ